jgi:hypothetical protein
MNAMNPLVETLHHGNHEKLLAPIGEPPRPASVDAIFVPSSRSAVYLDHAIRLADTLQCMLVVLCSGQSQADAVAARTPGNDRVVAIDVADFDHLLPDFETTRLLAGTVLERPADTSFKRNLGLLIARVAGWRRIVFLDDDIVVPDASDLEGAAALVDRFDAVGLVNTGFPDNSVVCHALRLIGGKQGTFVGGGALVLAPLKTFSFFPKTYNEDWFFLLSRSRLGSVGVYGRMIQKDFDPFEFAERAATEEFGDCLAEGIYWVLDNGGRIGQADHDHWEKFLDRRRRLIDRITMRVIHSALPRDQKVRVLASLREARLRRALIEPQLCVDYMRAWQRDRRLWCTFVQQFSKQLTLAVALKEIGIPDRAIHAGGDLALAAV